MTIAEAKILSIKKWQYVLDHFDDKDRYFSQIDEIIRKAEKKYGIERLVYGCPYCELFVKYEDLQITSSSRKAKINFKESCKGCPIALPEDYQRIENHLDCAQPEHKWAIMDEEQTRESVEDLLNLIKNS